MSDTKDRQAEQGQPKIVPIDESARRFNSSGLAGHTSQSPNTRLHDTIVRLEERLRHSGITGSSLTWKGSSHKPNLPIRAEKPVEIERKTGFAQFLRREYIPYYASAGSAAVGVVILATSNPDTLYRDFGIVAFLAGAYNALVLTYWRQKR